METFRKILIEDNHMDYETFVRILQEEGVTNDEFIMAIWTTREDRKLSEDRLRETARRVKKILPEYFEPLA